MIFTISQVFQKLKVHLKVQKYPIELCKSHFFHPKKECFLKYFCSNQCILNCHKKSFLSQCHLDTKSGVHCDLVTIPDGHCIPPASCRPCLRAPCPRPAAWPPLPQQDGAAGQRGGLAGQPPLQVVHALPGGHQGCHLVGQCMIC